MGWFCTTSFEEAMPSRWGAWRAFYTPPLPPAYGPVVNSMTPSLSLRKRVQTSDWYCTDTKPIVRLAEIPIT